MRRYKHFATTPEAIEHHELALVEDGNFIWMMTRSAPDAAAVSHDARGTWKRTGDTIVLEVSISSEAAPVPTVATVVGDRLEIAGVGTFA